MEQKCDSSGQSGDRVASDNTSRLQGRTNFVNRKRQSPRWQTMKATLEYKDDFLCVVEEKGTAAGLVREWRAVRKAEHAEVQTLLGRPVTSVNQQEEVYVDEEGNVYQLADNGETKPIEVEHLPETEKTELEVVLEASLEGRKANGQNGGAKQLLKRNRSSGRKQQALQMETAKPEARLAEAPPVVETSASTFNGAAAEAPVQLNLRQKLAEVRRRIGYLQKRGHNERFKHSYVT